MYRHQLASRAGSRPPSTIPTSSSANLKRKERDYDHSSVDETFINVVVRCRGRNDREVRENSGVVVSTAGVRGTNVELSMGPNAISNKTYQFDKVFSPAADQAILYDDVVAPILSEMMSGYNCTIFAYGQTGTGKTYTMSGDMTESCGLLTDGAGIIPRVLQSLFQKLEADESDCTVKCSFIELYNEDLRDLLSTDDSVKLKIYDDTNKKSGLGSTLVQGMEESHINSAAEGIARLQQGSLRRQVAATKCNDLSSRSHTIFTITTYIKKTKDSSDDYICSGKLNLVDLAGSENIQRSGAENKRATEAGLINKSLLTLGRVINALVDKSPHIPYRESKLTRLLQDSLGGRTKTCIIATVSPARSNLEETISTLDYAFRAKNIRNKPQINSMMSKKTLLKEFTLEIEKLKSELIATRQRNGVYLSNEKYEEMTVESESRRILSEEQKARIETMEVSLRNKVHELFSLTNNFTSLKKDSETMRVTLQSTKDLLVQTDLVLAHTKVELEAEANLRKKYAETEEHLHGVGHKLLSTVDQTVHDVDALHAKLRRRSALHAQNQERWDQARDHGKDIINNISTSLEELEEDHAQAVEVASERIQSFITAELARHEMAQMLASESAQSLSSGVQRTNTMSATARDEINNVVDGIKVLREEVKSKVGHGLNGLSEAAARISGEVISELEQFHTQLHSSYSSLGKDIKAAFEDLSKQLAAQKEEADQLRNALQIANHRTIEKSKEYALQIQTEAEAEKALADKENASLLMSITELMSAADRTREARLAALFSRTQSNLSNVATDLEHADQTFVDGMTKWAEQDATLRNQVQKAKDDTKNRFKQDWALVSERNSKIQQTTQAVHKETVRIVDAQIQDMAGQMAALDQFVLRAREQNDDYHRRQVETLDGLSTEVSAKLVDLQQRLSSSSMENFQVGIRAHMDEIISTFADVQERARQPLEQLEHDLGANGIVSYVPTGQTPQKRVWDYPTELPRTIPLPSTTPAGKPDMAQIFLAKTPSFNARKNLSPRKSPKKQIVHVDAPTVPASALVSAATAVPVPAPTNEVELPRLERSTTSQLDKSQQQLKELDANIPHSDAVSIKDLRSDDSKIYPATTSLDMPIKPMALTRSDSVTSIGEQNDKENIMVARDVEVDKLGTSAFVAPAPPTGKSRATSKSEKFSRSFHVPRLTRSSTAALKKSVTVGDFGRSVSG